MNTKKAKEFYNALETILSKWDDEQKLPWENANFQYEVCDCINEYTSYYVMPFTDDVRLIVDGFMFAMDFAMDFGDDEFLEDFMIDD
jgi:hypothetical protein